jgi:hypothetical protein
MEQRSEVSTISASAAIVAIGLYDHHPNLELLAGSASDLAEALARGGIVNGFPEGLSGGTWQHLTAGIQSWFSTARDNEHLVLYWSGHGKRQADGLYLIARDSPATNLNQTNAVEPRFIARRAACSKARRILIVFDACFSGEALSEVIKTVSGIIDRQMPTEGKSWGIAVLASTHATQRAQEGVLCRIFKDVLTDSQTNRRWSDFDHVIGSDKLFDTLQDEMKRRVPDQKIDIATRGSTGDLIPNPRFHHGRFAENVEERKWRLSQSVVGMDHFEFAARGIEVGATGGWYFAGREAVLRRLVGWMRTAKHGVRILTGRPGAGKSAVMGRLATLSDPIYRKATITAKAMAAEDEATVPPEGIIDVAIHAKGKTLDVCARALARALRISIGSDIAVDIEGLVAAVGKLDRQLTIIVDALDEMGSGGSGQGDDAARRLILPLGHLAQVRVLVGCRRSLDGVVLSIGEARHGRLRAAFGPDAIIDDLDDEADTREDIAGYVRRRLAASTNHRDNPSGITEAAERVATRAEGVFLYARIVSRTLQERGELDGKLPATTLDAFEEDLRTRFGTDQLRVNDLLAALAWAEGGGLTRRVWPLVANALTARVQLYNDDDVVWVLEQGGWHITEAGEDDQAVYRLSHQMLADGYRRRFDTHVAQIRTVEALSAGIKGESWLDCDGYISRHLASHAAHADRLDALIGDPGYLAINNPVRLIPLLSSVQTERGRRFADRLQPRRQPADRSTAT